MRFFSFKILVFCILLPPVLYTSTAYFLEGHLRDLYKGEIEELYIGDPQPLLDGSVHLRDAVNQNIDQYLQARSLISRGIEASVTVMTKLGKLLYPMISEPEDASPLTSNPAQVAAENYALMSEGLVIKVETKFKHFQMVSNLILACYLLLSLLILYFHYRSAMRKILDADRERMSEIDRLREIERINTERLEASTEERERLKSEFERLKGTLEDEKKKADRDEDELFEEIESLEAELNQNLELQNIQEEEILELKERIDQHQQGQFKTDKQKIKTSDAARKRFNTLYKNLGFHNRAISGYVELNEELKMKAEEVIHQLNEDPGLVRIKRKVFGGKGQQTVLEVLFGYKGRLYFRNTKDKRIEVLTIGTKNTQARELEFLAKL
jgi:Skp family chaperone for outer membrane proteins